MQLGLMKKGSLAFPSVFYVCKPHYKNKRKFVSLQLLPGSSFILANYLKNVSQILRFIFEKAPLFSKVL